MDWTSVWSALAATASAFTAGFVALREWVPGRVRGIDPTCYWMGYDTANRQTPCPALALLVAVQNLRGVSLLVRDLFVTAQADSWERPLRLQPEFQVEVSHAVTTCWRPVELFTPIGVPGRAVVARVVIFARRTFRDDPLAQWVAGRYTVRGFMTENGWPELFALRFRLERALSPHDEEALPVQALSFRLTPRRWAEDVLEARDRLGSTGRGRGRGPHLTIAAPRP